MNRDLLCFFYCRIIWDLIQIMTSQIPRKALRPGRDEEGQLLSFLAYLTEWELHVGGQNGFLSTSTAVDLRVTISSVLSLLNYLTQQASYEYVMTSKLSQDPVENLGYS